MNFEVYGVLNKNYEQEISNHPIHGLEKYIKEELLKTIDKQLQIDMLLSDDNKVVIEKDRITIFNCALARKVRLDFSLLGKIDSKILTYISMAYFW
jgi:hypothetical protein